MSAVQGGKFWTGFAAGALSSIASSAWQGGSTTEQGFFKENNWAYGTKETLHAGIGAGTGTVGMIAFGTIMGGAGAALTGGNFWQGAVTGLVVAGLNHLGHDGDESGDPPKRVSSKKFSKTKATYLLAEDVGLAGSFTVSGTVVTTADSDSNVLNIRVGASGTTLADMRGNVTFSGDVELMINNKVVARSNFQMPKGNQVYQSGTHPMGTAEFNVPNSASNVRINIRASYIFDNNGLLASPISSSFQSILIRR